MAPQSSIGPGQGGQTSGGLQTIPVTTSATASSSSTLAASTTLFISPTSTETTSIVTASSTPSETLAASSSNSKSSDGQSVGTIAGAAIGAAVGGALLAFIITFLIMRSRARKQSKQFRHSEKHNSSKQAEVSVAEISSTELARPKSLWEKHLPQPADDNSIRLNVKTLLHQIELHVETFYVNLPTPLTLTEEVQTGLHEVDSPYLPDSIIGMLPQVRDQTGLIKHCLANMILSNINGEGASRLSFLPLDFVALPQAMQLARRKSKKPVFSQALSRWRVLTSYLRPDTESDQPYMQQRDANINIAADTFCHSFSLWANPRYNSAARHQNLTEIMKSASETGILIFSQPSTFDYIWTAPASSRKNGMGFVVTPTFAKISDENAQFLDSPYVMVQPVVHNI